MADLEKIVKLIFEGDGKGLSTEMAKMDRDFTGFTNKIKDATGPLGDFGMGVAKAEAALIGLGAAGLIYAYGKAKEFENGVIDLDKVLSDKEGLAGGLDLAKEKAIEFSDKYGSSAQENIQSMADFRQANFDLTESIGLTNDAIQLSIAGNITAAESSDYLKRILSGFKAEASDSTSVMDSLNSVSNNYNANVQQLSIGLADLSPIAKTVNMSWEESIGLLTPIIEVFGSGAEAANALKTGLIRLNDNTPNTVKAIESLGVSQRDSNGQLKNAYVILGELAGAFKTTDESNKLFIAGEIFGKEQAGKMVQVLSDWGHVTDVTRVANEKLAPVIDEVNKRLAGATVAVDRAIEGWVNLNIAIGQKFATGATGAVNAFTDIENALRKSLGQESFDVVWDAINGFFDDTTQLLKTVAKNMPGALEGVDFSKLVQSFKGLGGEIGEALDALFGGELDLTTVEGLEDAIQKIVDIATKMTKFTEGFVDGLKPMLRIIGEITDGVTGMDDATVKSFGNMSGTAKTINEITEKLQLLEKAIYAIATGSIISAGSVMLPILDGIAAGFIGLVGAATAMGAGIAAGVVAVDTLFDKFLKLAGIDYKGIVDSYFDLSEAIQNIVDVVTGKKDWWTGEEIEGPEIKPVLLPISAQETEDAFWGVNEGIKAIEDNPIKITIDGSDLIKTDVLLDDLLSIPIIEDGINLPIWAKLEDEALQKDIASASKDGVVIAGKMSFDGRTWVEIEEEFKKPVEKPVELKPTILEQAKLDLERELNAVDNQAKTVQTAMEWKAKIDIADIEGSSKVATEAFSTIGASVVETSGNIAEMFSDLASGMNNMRTSDKWFMMDRLQEAQDKNSELIDSQIKLTEQQAEYMRLKNEALESGETAEIKIDTTGVEPAIEMVMWNIIEKVQIRANENAQEFLLGLPA